MHTSQEQAGVAHVPQGESSSAHSVSPSGPHSQPGRTSVAPPPKVPLPGLLMGIALVLGLAVWTGSRVISANHARQAVVTKRTDDAKRAAVEAKAPQKVKVIRGVPGSWQPAVEFEGTLAAVQSADLGFKVPGRIAAVRVKLGDKVKAGASLATLDGTEASSQLKAAEAQVAAAKAQLALAEDAERRTAQLVASGSVAEASGVQTSQQKSLAAAQLDAATAQAGLARVSLGNHALTAPFAGTITRVPDGVGAVVGPGVPLFALANLDNFKLKATVGEHDANLLRVGSEVQISTERGVAKGSITAIVGALDAQTRRVPVEATIQNSDSVPLRAGSFVRARVIGGEPIPVLRLPRETLLPSGQDDVLVVANGVLSLKRITFAVDKDDSLLVRHGLAEGEDVVLSPKPEAKSGDKVVVEGSGGK